MSDTYLVDKLELELDYVLQKHIIKVLEMTNHNKSEAARLLKIDRKTLQRYLQSWGKEKDFNFNRCTAARKQQANSEAAEGNH